LWAPIAAVRVGRATDGPVRIAMIKVLRQGRFELAPAVYAGQHVAREDL
jgi:hypothetical protein